MPEQETFFDEWVGDKRVIVLKTYDERFAREVLEEMTPEDLATLASSLDLDEHADGGAAPKPADDGFIDAMWDELQTAAREDWNLFSYFAVQEHEGPRKRNLYISP